MYKLTLTVDEQRAINWIGKRYRHGHDLYQLLVGCEWDFDGNNKEGTAWGWGTAEITFSVPENIAWQIADIIMEDNCSLACFSEDFKEKLVRFADSII